MTVRIKGNKKKRIPFELSNEDGTNVEELTTRGIPGWTFMEFFAHVANAGNSEDKTPEQIVKEEGAQAVELVEIFEEAMGDPEQFQRFRKFVRNPDNGYDLPKIQELFQALAEATADRPTQPSARSRNGRQTTKAGSTETASEPE